MENQPLKLTLPGRLPSWNQILAMNHWTRMKFKNQLASDFLCALRASASACSMKTTFAKNTMSTSADTLASYLETKRLKRASKRASAKRPKAKRSGRKLK